MAITRSQAAEDEGEGDTDDRQRLSHRESDPGRSHHRAAGLRLPRGALDDGGTAQAHADAGTDAAAAAADAAEGSDELPWTHAASAPGGAARGRPRPRLATDFAHQDLAGKFAGSLELYAGPLKDHGTHVAGIAAAQTNNGLGVAGAAPGASIYSIRVLDSAGNGDYSVIANGITEATNRGAR